MKLHGILLLDKPSGLTSNKFLQQVKQVLKVATKAGHTGSLDPLATGMLPICFGEATKFSNFLLNADKSYQVAIQLGVKTDTADLDGQIIATNEKIDERIFNPKWLNLGLSEFIGTYIQEPPIYSAIKHQGAPLYKLARKARDQEGKLYHDNSAELTDQFKSLVQAKARAVIINQIKILELCPMANKIILEVDCSKGTYIRSLVEDLGKKLDCYATVADLRRIRIAQFNHKDLITLEQIASLVAANAQDRLRQEIVIKNLLLPAEQCFVNLPKLYLNPEQTLRLQQGKKIYMPEVNNLYHINQLVSLFQENNTLLGVGEIIEDNLLISKRLVALDIN